MNAPNLLAPEHLAALSGAAVVDVRERWEYNDGHIPGAALIPLGRARERFPLALPDRTTPVVLISNAGERAALAAALLRSHQHVHVLAGGMEAWRANGDTIETGWGVPGKRLGEEIAHRISDIHVEPADLARDAAATLIVDIRPPWEHRQGHIPGAVNIPGELLPACAASLADLMRKGRYQRIVTHCAGRTRGIMAAALLRKLGMDAAYALRNGCMGWLIAGNRLENATNDLGLAHASVSPAALQQSVTPATLLAKIDSGEPVYIVDLRSPDQYARRHIACAIPLSAGQLVLESDLWLAQKHVPIVLVEGHPGQAAWVLPVLSALGYVDVAVLDGGTDAWTGAMSSRAEEVAQVCAAVSPEALPVEALEEWGRSGRIIDVRASGEWSMAHLAGSRCLPLGVLESGGVHDLSGDRWLIVSQNNVRALHAARILAGRGVAMDELRVVAGGLEALAASGYPLVIDQPDMRVATKDSGGRLSKAIWNRPFESELKPAMQAYLDWEEALSGSTSR